MESLFHINKYGVPSACTSPMKCPYRKNGHFSTYDEAKEEAESLYSEFKKGIPSSEDLVKNIRSYYLDYSAVTEFPINKKVIYEKDFDFIIISWIEKESVKLEMKRNMIAGVKFTPGEIIRVLNEELYLKTKSKINLDNYYDIPEKKWDKETYAQIHKFKASETNLAKSLNLESLSILCLPMEARKVLSENGFISTPENINEVVYKVYQNNKVKEIITYNHSINKITSTFSIFEIVGAMENVSLYSLTYSENMRRRFLKLWEGNNLKEKGFSYEEGLNKFINAHLFKDLQGTDVPKAFIKKSPIVAKEISGFFRKYKNIMLVMREKLIEENLEFYNQYVIFDENIEDDGEWMIES